MMPVKIREGAMAMLEVKSVPNLLGTPVSYAGKGWTRRRTFPTTRPGQAARSANRPNS
jgi:hypothetical protein